MRCLPTIARWSLCLALLPLAACDIGRQYDEVEPGLHEIRYRVAGTGRAAITYLDADAQLQEGFFVLPWEHRFQARADEAYYLSAKVLPGASDLDLRLSVDGTLAAETRAEGEFTVAAVAAGALDDAPQVRYRARGFHDQGSITFFFPTGQTVIPIEAVHARFNAEGVDTLFAAPRGSRLGVAMRSRKQVASGKLCVFIDIDLHSHTLGGWRPWVSTQRCAAREETLTVRTAVP